jgi:hypothetical protein
MSFPYIRLAKKIRVEPMIDSTLFAFKHNFISGRLLSKPAPFQISGAVIKKYLRKPSTIFLTTLPTILIAP